MGVTTYYSAGGELLGHRTDVGAAYGTDALGSVTVTAIDDQQRTPTNYYYKPYGSRLNKLGNNADPRYLWNGTSGYRETAISHSKSYVQARHLGQEEGRWTTVDPLWPTEPVFEYAGSSPGVYYDPAGLRSCHQGSAKDRCTKSMNDRFAGLCKKLNPKDPKLLKEINDCIKANSGSVNCPSLQPHHLTDLAKYCRVPPHMECRDDCKPDSAGIVPCATHDVNFSTGQCYITICVNSLDWQFGLCRDNGGDGTMDRVIFNILHELMHCLGFDDHGTSNVSWECQDTMACCIYKVITRGDTRKCKRH